MNRYELPAIPTQQLVSWTIVVALVTGAFFLLLRFHLAILLLFAAIILSTAIRPVVGWLNRRGVPRSIAALLLFLIVALILGGLLWFTLPIVIDQASMIGANLEQGYQALREGLTQLPNILVHRLLTILPEDLGAAASLARGFIPAGGVAAGDEVQGQVSRLLLGISQVVVIAILTVAWTLERDYIVQTGLLLVPARRREDSREMVGELESTIRRYVLGQAVLSLSIGIMALIAYLLIGLPYAFLLAFLAGLLAAIPFLGPFLGTAPAVVVGLSISPITAVWVIVAATVIQQVEGNLLVPRVMDKAIGVRPLPALLSLVALTSLFGILGALVSLPAAAVVQTLLDRVISNRETAETVPAGRDQLSVLRYRTSEFVHDVQSQIHHKHDEETTEAALEDELEQLALELERYLATEES